MTTLTLERATDEQREHLARVASDAAGKAVKDYFKGTTVSKRGAQCVHASANFAACIRKATILALDNLLIPNMYKNEEVDTQEMEIKFLRLHRDISTDGVLAELGKYGLRPANPAELRVCGAKFPELQREFQREFPVIAPGQKWRYPFGFRRVVDLSRDDGSRLTNLYWQEDGGDHYCFFAGVRK